MFTSYSIHKSPSFKHFLTLIFLSCLLSEINCGIKILSPKDLAISFNDEEITAAYGDFVQITSGFEAIGRLFSIPRTDDSDKNYACHPLNQISFPPESRDFTGINILIVEKGDCPYEEMARNAQKKGVNLLIIVNDEPGSVEKKIVTNTNEVHDVYIPVALVSYNDGTEIMNYMAKNPSQKIILNVSVKEHKTAKLKVDFFASIVNKESLKILVDFKNYYNLISNDVDFNLYYSTPTIEGLTEKEKSEACISEGKFCIIQPKDITQRNFKGANYVLDSLFHQSIYQLTKKIYFSYIEQYYNKCYNKYEYSLFCGYDEFSKDLQDLIFSNIFDSFGGMYLGMYIHDIDDVISRIKSYLSNTNKILVQNKIKEYENDVGEIPQVFINDKPIEGRLNSDIIFQSICNAFHDNKPAYCGDADVKIVIGNNSSFSWIQIIFIVIFIIIVNTLLFCCIKKYIVDKLADRINSSKIDLTNEVNSVCNSYFSLKDMENKKLTDEDDEKTNDLGDVHNFVEDENENKGENKEEEEEHDNNLVLSNNIQQIDQQ